MNLFFVGFAPWSGDSRQRVPSASHCTLQPQVVGKSASLSHALPSWSSRCLIVRNDVLLLPHEEDTIAFIRQSLLSLKGWCEGTNWREPIPLKTNNVCCIINLSDCICGIAVWCRHVGVCMCVCVPGQGGEGRLSQAVCTTLPGLQVLPAAHPHPFWTCYSLSQGKKTT